ncbi:MAG: glycosyltransferase family 2 protein, partial [Chloroflexia bacterium]
AECVVHGTTIWKSDLNTHSALRTPHSALRTPHSVSVVIPTYNRAVMLREAVGSVLEQTLAAREIVIVDDGSTDETAEAVEAFAAGGARIVYLSGEHENRRGPARNRGVAATTEELVAFLDSDDRWLPERLEKQVVAMAGSAAGFGFCNFQRFDESGPMERPFLPDGADYGAGILSGLLLEPLIVSSTLVVRRETFDAVGGFADLRMNEDYELTLRLATAYPACYVPEVLVEMRQHAGRTSFSHGELPLLDHVAILEGFLEGHPALTHEERAAGRAGLANLHYKLARHYLAADDVARARRHLRALFRLRPWDRRMPGAYLRSWVRRDDGG